MEEKNWDNEIHELFEQHKRENWNVKLFNMSEILGYIFLTLLPFIFVNVFYILGGFNNFNYNSVIGLTFVIYYSFSPFFVFLIFGLLTHISSRSNAFDRFEDTIIDFFAKNNKRD